MRAVVYQGPHEITVENVEDPRLERPTDALVRITSTCICGSDLHMYEGRTDVEPGFVFGHEPMGVVEEVGPAVVTVRPGDRVSMPFNIGCGFCFNCERGYFGACLTVNPGSAGGAYGYADMGPYTGGQAEYLRVPFADFNCLQLPQGDEHERDFALLADIFPTGYHGAELAGVKPGETVAVWGAGPVGLMAALSSIIRGAAVVYVVDQVDERLEKAREIGCVPIDQRKGNPAEQIKELRKGDGVMKGIECVGYQAHDPRGEEHPNMTLNGLIEVLNATGRIGCPGVFLPQDPGARDPHARSGIIDLEFGMFFQKGLTIGAGQAHVKRYNRYLRDLIVAGRVTPSFVVSHEVSIDEAPQAYEKFDRREDGYTKVILRPAA